MSMATNAEASQKSRCGIYNTTFSRRYYAFIGLAEISNLTRYIDFMETIDPGCLPPQFRPSRYERALYRLLNHIGRHTRSLTTVDRQREQPIVNT